MVGGAVVGTTAKGGNADMIGGQGGSSGGAGGDCRITAGLGGSTTGPGGDVFIKSGFPTDGRGGHIYLEARNGGGATGAGGDIHLQAGSSAIPASTGQIFIGAVNAKDISIGNGSNRVVFPTGTVVTGMARIKNASAIIASDTADSGERMIYDPTAGTFTLTAPSGPSIGDRWGVKNRSSDVTAITIAGNGNNIEDPTVSFALAATFSLVGDGAAVEWEYDGTQWLVI
jgi:hypothetical protein